jgi:hypothetical protein
MMWLKRQIRDAQEKIIQLHETHRRSKERNWKHLREHEAVEEEFCIALASAQKKHD